MKRRSLLLAFAAASLGEVVSPPPAGADGEEIAVIVHKANPLPSMNRAQLSAIFRAKSTQFPSGGHASAVNLPQESAVRQAFDYAVLGLKPEEVERYWLDSKIRSGVGSPRKLPGPAAVVHFVGSDESAIGYVSRRDAGESVRVVARIRGGQVVGP